MSNLMHLDMLSWFHLGSEGKLDNGTRVDRLQSAQKKLATGYSMSCNFLGEGGGVVSPKHTRLAVYCHMSSFHYVCYFSSKSHC